MQYTVETLPGGTQVFTSPRHRFGTDALVLLAFCDVRKTWTACDLGCGCGILLLGLADKGLSGTAVGVEVDPVGGALLLEAAKRNGYAHVHSVVKDLREYRPSRQFDLVVSNPPYYNEGALPKDAQRAAARHETSVKLKEVCGTAARILKDRGRFNICYPAAKLAMLLTELRAHNLEPKRLQMVRKTAEDEAWLVLVTAQKATGPGGLRVLPDRLLPPGKPVQY